MIINKGEVIEVGTTILIEITDEELCKRAKTYISNYYLINIQSITNERVYLRLDSITDGFEYVVYIYENNELFYDLEIEDELIVPIHNINEVIEIYNSL